MNAMTWDYLVASVQQAHVTWVNGKWNGARALDSGADEGALLDSCPQSWDYLAKVGAEGWELVSSNVQQTSNGPPLTTLYLKRPR